MERRKNEEKKKIKKEKNREEDKRSEKLHLLSTFYGNRTVGFHWSKRQSYSMRQELRVRTRILGFCQTLRDRGFPSTRFHYFLRSISMA